MSGTNGNLPWDKRDPSLGQTGTRPGTNWPFSVEFHSKIAILSLLSLVRIPVCPWDDCPAGAVRKNAYVFSVYWLFRPQMNGLDPFIELPLL